MLKDKIKTVFKAIGGTNDKIASFAGVAGPNIGKLANGSRVPARTSSTAYRLAHGIYGFAEANGKINILCETIGCSPELSAGRIRHRLLEWLYEDVITTEDDPSEFGSRLKKLLTATGLDNTDISREMGVNIVRIDAFCSERHIPSRKSVLFNKMCATVASYAAENDSLDNIAELIGYPPDQLTEEAAVPLIIDWLRGKKTVSDNKMAAQLISRISSPAAPMKLPDVSKAVADVINDDKNVYVGISGLQRAVIRFLWNAANTPEEELLLYSDQNMEWMQASFTPKWLALMAECLKNGVKMRIIHNIDRDPAEITFAIQSWLPLYMSGLIEPTYRFDSSGDRFRHTVFISSGACIDGFCTSGSERECIYHYSEDKEYISQIRHTFERFNVNSKPLMKFERGQFKPEKNYRNYDLDGIRLCIASNEAVVLKLTEPQCSFRFRHPYLIKMLSVYAQSVKDVNKASQKKNI